MFLGNDGTVYFRCFACGAKGDVFSFIALGFGLNATTQFRRVISITASVADAIDAATPPILSGVSENTVEPHDAFMNAAVLTTLLLMCPLTAQADVARYLEGRRVLAEAERDGWGALPPPAGQKVIIDELVAEFGSETMEKTGFIAANGAFFRSSHRLMIPWRSPSSWLLTLQRRLPRDHQAGEMKYANTSGCGATWPYGVEGVKSIDTTLAITEGAIDALSMRLLCAKEGVTRAVVGLPSARTWRRSWAELGRGRFVIVALDADDAGEGGVAQIARDLRAAGAKQVVRAVPRGHKDWNALLLGVAS